MKMLNRLLAVASAAFLIAGSAFAQTSGTVTNHAFAIGKGAGTTGYTSLLCGSAQLAVGQAAADPICRTITGDVTIDASGVTTLATVNSNVGAFGGVSAVPNLTVNAKGLVTAAGSQAYQNGTSAVKGVVQCDGTTITCSSGVITAVGAVASSVAVGTTTVTGGSSGDDLYNNAGVLGSRTRANPTQQIFLSGSGTYTKPANVLWIRVRGVGGGGGGAGSGSGGGTSAGAGGTTTFGSSVLTALGGGGGTINSNGGIGGAITAFAGSPLPVGLNVAGGEGGAGGGLPAATNATINGGNGGSSCLGGGGSGGGGTGLNSPSAGKTNTGSGGGGGASNTSAIFAASGGGAGACFYATINSPSSTYAYAVGAAGSAGGAGAGGQAGAAGGSGGIWVEEYYAP